jgi:hypothetical protein
MKKNLKRKEKKLHEQIERSHSEGGVNELEELIKN